MPTYRDDSWAVIGVTVLLIVALSAGVTLLVSWAVRAWVAG